MISTACATRCAIVALAVLFVAVPSGALADMAKSDIAYAWIYHPDRAPEALPAEFYYSTFSESVRFQRQGPGDYRVTFGRRDNRVSGGNVQVTGYFTPHHCKVARWSGNFTVDVRCFDADGNAAEASFLVLVTLGPQHGRDFLAYLWANEPGAARYTPSKSYSYNSSGGGIVISRVQAGSYRVEVESGASADAIGGGNVQVTAYGSGAEYCKSAGWVGYDSPYTFTVLCFDPDGRPVDTQFTALVIRPGDDRSQTGTVATHDSFYLYSGAADQIDVTKSGEGIRTVQFANLGDISVLTNPGDRIGPIAGHVQVSAVGRGTERCNVREWYTGRDSTVSVSCFDEDGNPVETDFSLLALFP